MGKQKILESKILIPDVSEDYEQREELLSGLQGEEGKLLVLHAPIGYGKTVLMSQYARLPGHVCAWYHLDSTDNELKTFVRYLGLSLSRALGGFDFAEELWFEEDTGLHAQLGRSLLTELEGRLKNLEEKKLVLVLDDLQELKNPEIFKLLEELLNHTDRRFVLMAATKDVVPDSFRKWIMRHGGTMVEAKHLSFRKTEVRSILGRMLSGEEARRYTEMVWRNTKGWPAGVMLAALYSKFRDAEKAAEYVVMEEKTQKNKRKKLQVSCFGKFRVVILETGREISWRTRKAMELFAYLVDMEGRPVERRVLLEQLWPDNAPNNEVAMLHNMIYSIRKELSSQPELKNLIQYKGRQYHLDTSQIKVDLDSKKQICKLAEMGKGKELYKHREKLLNYWGAYMKEVDGTWCMARRAYFERTYGKACSLLADYCREIGDLETEVSCWSACMTADRYSEEAVIGLLRCYGDMGERYQMRQVFKSAQKIFREEMGIELSREIVQIYEQGLKNRRT